PISDLAGDTNGWRWGLWAWAVLSALAVLPWLITLRGDDPATSPAPQLAAWRPAPQPNPPPAGGATALEPDGMDDDVVLRRPIDAGLHCLRLVRLVSGGSRKLRERRGHPDRVLCGIVHSDIGDHADARHPRSASAGCRIGRLLPRRIRRTADRACRRQLGLDVLHWGGGRHVSLGAHDVRATYARTGSNRGAGCIHSGRGICPRRDRPL